MTGWLDASTVDEEEKYELELELSSFPMLSRSSNPSVKSTKRIFIKTVLPSIRGGKGGGAPGFASTFRTKEVENWRKVLEEGENLEGKYAKMCEKCSMIVDCS